MYVHPTYIPCWQYSHLNLVTTTGWLQCARAHDSIRLRFDSRLDSDLTQTSDSTRLKHALLISMVDQSLIPLPCCHIRPRWDQESLYPSAWVYTWHRVAKPQCHQLCTIGRCLQCILLLGISLDRGVIGKQSYHSNWPPSSLVMCMIGIDIYY